VPLKYLAVKSIIGDKVYNKQKEYMGKIGDIMIDINTGRLNIW